MVDQECLPKICEQNDNDIRSCLSILEILVKD